MNVDMVIYHANCVDGFTAAWAAWRRWPEAEFVPAQYGDDPPDVEGRDVIIVDFSYPRETLRRMRDGLSMANTIQVFDHHKTAQSDLESLDFCTFDMERSGAGLAWDELIGGKRPPLIDYVEDRDLWRWHLSSSREVSAYIALQERDFITWDELEHEVRCHWDSVVEKGEVALRVTDRYVAQKKEEAGRVRIAGHVVPCVNTTWAVSETVGALAKDAPFAAGWFQRTDGKFVYQLRSRRDGADVSEVARLYGGGGHHGAAGFVLDELLPQEEELT